MPAEENEQNQTRDHSFDELAKGLANRSLSRRDALKWVGAAITGGLLASVPGVAWATHKPGHKQPPPPPESPPPPPPGCPEGKIDCGSGCIDPSTDYHNCGGCGNLCFGNECCGGICCGFDANGFSLRCLDPAKGTCGR